ncbi:hypothetical protein WUBG_12598 [Wuchereria bancrofti]|uniref:Uncharacterized protein n=1 Tax=Wuchereria bancrofti TaxID=6293 RepID=J9EHK0_WUCBA|nr:hypothetical protein WUBG_12598 [Wuchereria bancrofti]
MLLKEQNEAILPCQGVLITNQPSSTNDDSTIGTSEEFESESSMPKKEGRRKNYGIYNRLFKTDEMLKLYANKNYCLLSQNSLKISTLYFYHFYLYGNDDLKTNSGAFLPAQSAFPGTNHLNQ